MHICIPHQYTRTHHHTCCIKPVTWVCTQRSNIHKGELRAPPTSSAKVICPLQPCWHWFQFTHQSWMLELPATEGSLHQQGDLFEYVSLFSPSHHFRVAVRALNHNTMHADDLSRNFWMASPWQQFMAALKAMGHSFENMKGEADPLLKQWLVHVE